MLHGRLSLMIGARLIPLTPSHHQWEGRPPAFQASRARRATQQRRSKRGLLGRRTGARYPIYESANSRRHCCRRPLLIQRMCFAYFGYLNSGAAFSASLVVFIVATHLSFLVSCLTLTE